jgi:hypothetical protein
MNLRLSESSSAAFKLRAPSSSSSLIVLREQVTTTVRQQGTHKDTTTSVKTSRVAEMRIDNSSIANNRQEEKKEERGGRTKMDVPSLTPAQPHRYDMFLGLSHHKTGENRHLSGFAAFQLLPQSMFPNCIKQRPPNPNPLPRILQALSKPDASSGSWRTRRASTTRRECA